MRFVAVIRFANRPALLGRVVQGVAGPKLRGRCVLVPNQNLHLVQDFLEHVGLEIEPSLHHHHLLGVLEGHLLKLGRPLIQLMEKLFVDRGVPSLALILLLLSLRLAILALPLELQVLQSLSDPGEALDLGPGLVNLVALLAHALLHALHVVGQRADGLLDLAQLPLDLGVLSLPGQDRIG